MLPATVLQGTALTSVVLIGQSSVDPITGIANCSCQYNDHHPTLPHLSPLTSHLSLLNLREFSQHQFIDHLNPMAAPLDVLAYIIYIIKEVAEGIQ